MVPRTANPESPTRNFPSDFESPSITEEGQNSPQDRFDGSRSRSNFILSGFKVPAFFVGRMARKSVYQDIQKAFDCVAKLSLMDQEKIYRLRVGRDLVTAYSDDFLRRRTGKEILTSGLSSGCGDFAIAFYSLMKKKGYEASFIESVRLSADALRTRNNGHTGVAIFDEARQAWILTDPTSQEIVQKNWNPDEKIYLDRYWIGFVGELDDYPAHNHEELKNFYGEIFETIPTDVLEEYFSSQSE